VEPTYFEQYQTSLRTPSVPSSLGGARIRVDAMLPAATLEAAYFDKLTAFATPTQLEWRDLFDVWWIVTQQNTSPAIDGAAAKRLLENMSA